MWPSYCAQPHQALSGQVSVEVLPVCRSHFTTTTACFTKDAFPKLLSVCFSHWFHTTLPFRIPSFSSDLSRPSQVHPTFPLSQLCCPPAHPATGVSHCHSRSQSPKHQHCFKKTHTGLRPHGFRQVNGSDGLFFFQPFFPHHSVFAMI